MLETLTSKPSCAGRWRGGRLRRHLLRGQRVHLDHLRGRQGRAVACRHGEPRGERRCLPGGARLGGKGQGCGVSGRHRAGPGRSRQEGRPGTACRPRGARPGQQGPAGAGGLPRLAGADPDGEHARGVPRGEHDLHPLRGAGGGPGGVSGPDRARAAGSPARLRNLRPGLWRGAGARLPAAGC